MLPLISGLEFPVAHQMNDKGPIPLQEDYKSSSLLTTYELKHTEQGPFRKSHGKTLFNKMALQTYCTLCANSA